MRGKTGKIAIFGFYEIIEYGCDSGGTGAATAVVCRSWLPKIYGGVPVK